MDNLEDLLLSVAKEDTVFSDNCMGFFRITLSDNLCLCIYILFINIRVLLFLNEELAISESNY